MTSDHSPDFTVYCHCDDCRRATGAPVIASVGFSKNTVTWEAKDTLSRHVRDTCARLFCSQCGTPVAQEHESRSDMTFFNTGFMDNPNAYPPTYHSFEGEQLEWLELHDNLPRHAKTILIETH